LSGGEHLLERDRLKIGRQIVLPLSKAIEIAWKSIRIRLWRSLITTSGIILAIAFLTSVWTSGAITSALQEVPEDDPNYPLVVRVLQRQAIARENISIRVGIVGRQTAAATSSRGTPAVLVRDFLQERQEFSPFLIPASLSGLQRALEAESAQERPDAIVVTAFPPSLAVPETAATLAAFTEGGGTLVVIGYEQLWPAGTDEAAVAAFDELLPGQPGSGRVQSAADLIKPSGHPGMGAVKWTDQPEMTYMQVQPREEARALARCGGEGILWTAPRGKGVVFWYPVVGPQVSEAPVLAWFLEGRVLMDSLRWGAREKFRGGTAAKRNLWLISLSLLVCVVGITNAMLMSVTERFREIGTMKCLGALDSFVVRLFLIESSFQGAGGSLLGAVLGLLLAFVRALFSYRITDVSTGRTHWFAVRYFPGLHIVLWLLVAVLVGVVLSVIAAIYPAYRAARMEPVEAMRAEA